MFLFGHSFVRRTLGRRAGELSLIVADEQRSVQCYGEGGLSFSRMRANPRRYFRILEEASSTHSVLVIDLGTNDLSQAEPVTVARRLWEFVDELGRRGLFPTAIFLLPVLPRTRRWAGSTLSLREFNSRVEEFNRLMSDGSFHRDFVWVWEHRLLPHAPHLIIDGVHLTPRGTELYRRTLRRISSFCRKNFWM